MVGKVKTSGGGYTKGSDGGNVVVVRRKSLQYKGVDMCLFLRSADLYNSRQ